ESVTKLLKAHGYDPAEYDVLTIAEEYRQETGGYESIFANPSIVFAYVDQQAPQGFVLRDWDAPEHDDTAPRDRFVVADGPESGGVESNWQPGWGVLIDLPAVGHTGDGLGVSVEEARQLRDDLTAVLQQLE